MKRLDSDPRRVALRRRTALAAIFAGALAVRLVGLGGLPNGLFCDEAANGLDAHSLLTTGRSLGGEPWPLLLEHHGIDWVEPLYTWVSIPAVALFGLSALSTRLVAAVAGSLLVLAAYGLARRLFEVEVALAAAALTALSPWLVILSRVGVRGMLLPLLLTAALCLFLDGLERRRSLALAGLAFGLTLQTYTVAKAVVPLVLLALLALFGRELWEIARRPGRQRRGLGAGTLVLAALAAHSYLGFWAGPGGTRFDDVSVLAAPQPLRLFAANLALQVDPLFLFLGGDPKPRTGIGGFGLVLGVLAPFVVVGLVAAARRRPRGWLPLAVFAAGSVAAALTLGGPHALRGIGAAPHLEILAALGLVATARGIAARRRSAVAALLGLLVAVQAGLFLWAYFARYPERSPYAFQYGLEQAIAAAEEGRDRYDRVFLSPLINQAYVFPLFFARLDPRDYHDDRQIDYYLPMADEDRVRTLPAGRYLYVARPCEQVRVAPARPLAAIEGPDGYRFFQLWEVELERPGLVVLRRRGACGLPQPASGWEWAERVTHRHHEALRRAIAGAGASADSP